MNYIRILLIVAFTCSLGLAGAQDQAKPDSLVHTKTKVEHSPRKATLYSAVLPGLGQIYNKKYWKVPIIYGGFVTCAYFIDYYNEEYIKYKNAYADIMDSDPKTNSFLDIKGVESFDLSKPSDVTDLAYKLNAFKDKKRRWRDLDVIITAAVYALNIIDASVDGHFFNFDMSEDLSIVWAPGPVYCMDQKMIGIRCQITF